MRKLLLLVALVAAIAGASAGAASAVTGSGQVCWTWGCGTGAPCGALVEIHNVTTGANGSTRTACNTGYWQATNMVATQTYQVRAHFDAGCTRYWTAIFNAAPLGSSGNFGFMPLDQPTTRLC